MSIECASVKHSNGGERTTPAVSSTKLGTIAGGRTYAFARLAGGRRGQARVSYLERKPHHRHQCCIQQIWIVDSSGIHLWRNRSQLHDCVGKMTLVVVGDFAVVMIVQSVVRVATLQVELSVSILEYRRVRRKYRYTLRVGSRLGPPAGTTQKRKGRRG